MRKILLISTALILMHLNVYSQCYIQIRQKSMSEEISPDFTFNTSGGVAAAVSLNDKPDAVDYIFNISGDDNGGIFAIADASDSWSINPGNLYCRTSGSSVGEKSGIEAFKIAGINDGGYASLYIPVSPGVYTIGQSPVAGWQLTDIQTNKADTAGTTHNLGTATATIAGSDGEVVMVEFESRQLNTTSLATICGSNFLENFSSYASGDWGNPVEGMISHHKTTGNFGYGHYAVVPSSGVLSYGDTVYDHTSGDASGSMLLIDATFEKGIFYRRRFTDLVPGARYSFGAWITNFNPSATDKPDVSFEVYDANGNLLSSVSSGAVPDSGWHNFATTFDSDGSDIDLVLRNNTLGTAGNDLAIDDISFGLSVPRPEAITSFDCNGGQGTITITAPLSMDGETSFEYSVNGIDWQTSPEITDLDPDFYTLSVRCTSAPAQSCTGTSVISLTGNCIVIGGNIIHDPNGDVVLGAGESPVSGSNADDNGGTSSVAGANIYASLVDENGEVVIAKQVNADGTYVFSSVERGRVYSVILTTAEQRPGVLLTTGTFPANWMATGTHDPVNGLNTGNLSFVVPLGLVTRSILDVNFGIQQPPVADIKEYAVRNSAFSSTPPAGFPDISTPGDVWFLLPMASAELTGISGGALSGSDPEDCSTASSCSNGATFSIHAISSNTRLFYDFGAANGVMEADMTGGPLVIDNFDMTKMVIYAQEGSGASDNTIGFRYSISDEAGVSSNPVTYTIETTTPLPVMLRNFTATQHNQHPVEIHPNPTTDYITVKGLSGSATVKIYSTDGRMVKEVLATGNAAIIGINDLNAGMYHMHIVSGSGTVFTTKVIKL
jgi:hypothetical protein